MILKYRPGMMCLVPEDSYCLLWLMCAAIEDLKLGVFFAYDRIY